MQPWVYFLIFGALVFIMMRGGCGAHVMGHGHHHRSDDNRETATGGSVPSDGPAATVAFAAGYTVVSEYMNTVVRQSWSYILMDADVALARHRPRAVRAVACHSISGIDLEPPRRRLPTDGTRPCMT
jgi:hypothetical protein